MTNFIIIGLIILVVLVVFMILAKFIGLWIRARVSNAPIGLLNLVAMWIRKVPTSLIVDSRITAAKAGLDFTTDQLEAHYLAGGHVADVVLALIAADKAGIPLSFDRACAIDLAVKGTSKTVLEAVRTSINPAVIDCPGGGGKIDAVARDGIQLRARAKVTVRTNLDRFVGGATEETIIARVNEGIVTSIGSAVSHKDVLENPDHISKRVLERGLDANTQFEILSIDIADVDVGQNIGATLQASQAEADKQVAQARAEVRRAAFKQWCVDEAMMAVAKPDALFMHCLPAHRGEEVSAEVIDGPQSVVWDEAENRMHVQKALMEYLLLGRIG